MSNWTDILPFNRANIPYRDAGTTFHKSTAALTGTTSVVVDFTSGLGNTLNTETLVTKGEFFNSVQRLAAFPTILGMSLGAFTGNTASSALPKVEIHTETAPTELLTGNPRIQAASSLDYVNDSTQIMLFGWNKHPENITKMGVVITLPAAVSLSSLTLFLNRYEPGSYTSNI
jgi:hypothetical protein